MPIEFNCHVCGKLLRTSDEKAGRTAACPGCGEKLSIPGETAEAEEEHDDFPDDDEEFDGFDDVDDFESSSARSAPRRRSRQHSRSRRSSSQNTLAVISLISGITGLVMMVPGFCCGCLFILSLPFDLAAVVTGSIALHQIGKEGGDGKPMALAGVICGALALIIFATLLAVGVAVNLNQPQQFNF